MAEQPFDDDTRKALHRRIALERTIASVSRQLVVADGDALDVAIENTLQRLGEFVGADRAYIFQFHPDGLHIFNSHEWCADGITPQKSELQHLYFDPASLFSETMHAGAVLDIPNVPEMDDQHAYEREVLLAQGIQSLLAAPIVDRQELIGFVGFDAVRHQRHWTPEDHSLLELAVEGLRNSFLRRRNDLVLRASEERFRDLFEHTPKIAVQGYDEQRRVVFWNRASEALYGYTEAEACGRLLEDLIIPEPMRAFVVQAHHDWLVKGVEIPASELTLQRKDGSPVQVFSSHMLRRAANGKAEMYCVDIDLTEQKAAQAGLLLAASVFEHARENILVVSADGLIVAPNPSMCRATGFTRDQLQGKPIDQVQHNGGPGSLWQVQWEAVKTEGSWSGECHQIRSDGSSYPVLATLSALRPSDDAVPEQVVALYADISLQKAHEAELHFMATHDALTGLPNRSLLHDRLTQALLRCQRNAQKVAVAYIDLDGFKEVNDTHGHAVGDELLRRVTSRMQTGIRGVDTLARLGGDEFVAVFVDLPTEAAVIPMLTRLLQTVGQSMDGDGMTLRTTASIGVTFGSGEEPADADTLLRQADLAMYQAKVAGKNRFAFFDARLDKVVRLQHEKESRFAAALHQGELLLYYQPVVNLRTGQVTGMEALLRWNHPDHGLLLPADFLPYVERQELCVELGEWVIRTALTHLTGWLRQGLSFKVNVNIAGQHLQHPPFVTRLIRLLADFPEVSRELLVLELLESSALGSLDEVAGVIRACRELGIGVALDDFGTGYSSLTYLKQLPANVLKIDHSFVRDMLHDPGDRTILSGILLLGRAFGRMVVAEGVESVEQGAALEALGCEYAQGFGIARPMPAQEVADWVRGWKPPSGWVQETEAV